ncbi:hypothetical protein QEG98_15715 [Myxococcus sp. MxC21-1]|nr:hypothetical protein QEG98_15715 [Myxococcus sp. MxC21-1]
MAEDRRADSSERRRISAASSTTGVAVMGMGWVVPSGRVTARPRW